MKSLRTHFAIESIPVDFLADPDGLWEYDSLAESAGFDPSGAQELAVGALTEPFEGFPEGAAVVALGSGPAGAVALVDCTA